jgi:hypothetical protein
MRAGTRAERLTLVLSHSSQDAKSELVDVWQVGTNELDSVIPQIEQKRCTAGESTIWPLGTQLVGWKREREARPPAGVRGHYERRDNTAARRRISIGAKMSRRGSSILRCHSSPLGALFGVRDYSPEEWSGLTAGVPGAPSSS